MPPIDTARVMREATGLAHQRLPRLKMPLGSVIERLRQARPTVSTVVNGGPAPVADGAQFLTCSFTCAAGTRAYKLYVPKVGAEKPALIVMLHGCTQNPDDFARGTRMNTLAEEFGFLVAYPHQTAATNPQCCWNWFQPGDQARGAGEPAIIAGITRAVAAEFGVDAGRIFVAGLSAGGAMAAVVGDAYPDVYAAVGVHSGLPVGCATDVVSAFAAMRGEHAIKGRVVSGANSPRIIVFHGGADRTVHPSNADRIVANYGGAQFARACRLGEGGGRAYACTTLQGRTGETHVELWLIADSGHAWSGGDPTGSFADASGPDASREMVRFFLA